MSLIEKVKEKAFGLGFSLAGITTPDPPPHWPVFQDWLALGRHGSMGYLADPRRADPGLVLQGCRSILVLAAPYPALGSPPGFIQTSHTGRVAAYAWGTDYHLVLSEKLEALAGFIEQETGMQIPSRWYSDTGPLLERDLAQRAGLGWIGRNTCLINPALGSTFFLAEILLGIELEPDSPFTADRCGTCTRCLEACPTACILPDRTLDARRCISYLTIENKGEIPPELRPKMGNWIFGCDICQEVCPWNQRAGSDRTPVFHPRIGVPAPDLVAELSLTPQGFNRKFKDSPIRRAKRDGYLRNVAVALGNARTPAAIPALERAVQVEGSLVSQHATWALDQIKKGHTRQR